MVLITLGQKVKKSHNIYLALRLGYAHFILEERGGSHCDHTALHRSKLLFLTNGLAPYEIGKGKKHLAPGYWVTTSYKVQGEGPAQIVCKIYWAC